MATAPLVPPSITTPFRFDGKNVNALDAAQAFAAKRVTEVSDETRKALKAVVARAFREQIPPYEAARIIKPMIGLTSRQAQAAMNYRVRLIDSGLPLDKVDSLHAKYVAKKLRYRSRMIARTETINSLAHGKQVGWEQAQKKGLLPKNATKRITLGANPCPICIGIQRAGPVPLNGFFQTPSGRRKTPTFHPHCTCAVVIDRPGGPAASKLKAKAPR